ncbi:hypothetical protein Nepgr_007931 [Nepenthes gracilis]|uniref:Uncharacterized protein n=1 Tax=Nepenthes gracilis TaxID=150966 RepID=A0AAD3XIZ5_NEPGR|nr:hypothetical protein Nepgr_007931 [Nepenthes gracilis]
MMLRKPKITSIPLGDKESMCGLEDLATTNNLRASKGALEGPLCSLELPSPSIASPRPLNNLGELEVFGGDLKTNISEQALIAIPATTEDTAPIVNTQVDPSFPPGDVHGEEAFTANSISDGVSLVSQECKINNFSPLAREVAARIKVLLHSEDKSVHRDEALSC